MSEVPFIMLIIKANVLKRYKKIQLSSSNNNIMTGQGSAVVKIVCQNQKRQLTSDRVRSPQ